jgi:hypothetical protein
MANGTTTHNAKIGRILCRPIENRLGLMFFTQQQIKQINVTKKKQKLFFSKTNTITEENFP